MKSTVKTLLRKGDALAHKHLNFDQYYFIQKQLGFPIVKHNFRHRLSYELNLIEPRTFNQKLTHRKLHCRDPTWISVTDKVAVRDWLAQRGLPTGLHLIPMITICDSVEKLAVADLPKSFIVKAAWASGQNCIVHDYPNERDKVIQTTTRWYKNSADYGRRKLIWAAQHIPRRLIIEELLCDEQNKVPVDYKFFCFHGRCKFIQVDTDRFDGHKRQLFQRDLMPIDVAYNKPIGRIAELPAELPKMIDMAEQLAADFGFLRVDLYHVDQQVFFGELTQTPENGTGFFNPSDFDSIAGEYWAYP